MHTRSSKQIKIQSHNIHMFLAYQQSSLLINKTLIA
jgi:hypothetical protein